VKLSVLMRDALNAAACNPLRRTHDTAHGKPPWPAHPATLAALVRHGFLVRTEKRNRRAHRVEEWAITDTGREALNPPPRHRPDRPLYMARCGAIQYRVLPNGRWAVAGGGSEDYTTDPRKSIDVDRGTAVEVMPVDLERFAARAREREHQRKQAKGIALDGLTLEDRIGQVKVAARACRVDISGELWVVQRMLAFGRGQSAGRRLARLETQLRQRAA
jgi:hypothetical protein